PPPAPRAPAARARWAAASGSSGSHLELRTQIHRTGPGSTAPPGDTPDPDGPEPPTAYAPELFPGPVAPGPLAGPGQGRARRGQGPVTRVGGVGARPVGIRWISVATHGVPAKLPSVPTSECTSAGARQRARVRCGWYPRPPAAGGAPARRAPAPAEAASRPRPCRSPWMPVPSTPARAAPGKAPPP